MLNFCDFIQVFVFTTNHHLKEIQVHHNFPNFYKGEHFVTFCLLSWRMKPIQKEVTSYWKEFTPLGANSYFKSLTIEKEDKNENDRVAFPKCVPIHLQ